MNKKLLFIFLALFFIKNLSADINKEVQDLKNEFNCVVQLL